MTVLVAYTIKSPKQDRTDTKPKFREKNWKRTERKKEKERKTVKWWFRGAEKMISLSFAHVPLIASY